MSGAPSCRPAPDGSCALCGDVAHPMTVRRVDAASRMAAVDGALGSLEVALDLVGPVEPGAVLLVHQGFAITVLGTS